MFIIALPDTYVTHLHKTSQKSRLTDDWSCADGSQICH